MLGALLRSVMAEPLLVSVGYLAVLGSGGCWAMLRDSVWRRRGVVNGVCSCNGTLWSAQVSGC